MSYMRAPHILEHFDALSDLYVYRSNEGMEDCHATYEHNPSLIELIGTIIARETEDEAYARKIVEVLAHKMGCADQLRPKQLDFNEWMEEEIALNGLYKHGGKAIDSFIIIRNMSWSDDSEEDAVNYIADVHNNKYGAVHDAD